jgi:hypothetical protein
MLQLLYHQEKRTWYPKLGPEMVWVQWQKKEISVLLWEFNSVIQW